jgi:hypothetical protein
VYVLDWHDADICGSKVLNSETGRIFRSYLKIGSTKLAWPVFGSLEDGRKELVALQNSIK